ncbi:MAG: retropepsin-like aspartic protease [Candidatus Omnitrophica bacterium]|jgi:clan AA aspartic protease (TIGR02281 family)|nr:retroviral-like aspartic protease family protein [Candidatus Omnitrophota bacterium]MDD3275105.1 retropepsin-like aspartic protease [Candidatus Omnitrophota bacterium]MDD5078343.1 retropepsin-like aspartic protease [Candidatus Omnitrophota bacterium]
MFAGCDQGFSRDRLNGRLNLKIFFRRYIFLAGVLLFVFQPRAGADTVHLKNGRDIEGIIVKEDDTGLSLEMNCGMVKLPKEQVESVRKSSAGSAEKIRQEWLIENESFDTKREETEKDQARAPAQGKLEEQNGHFLAEVVLNKKVKARLLLDTGASLVAISGKIASELGIDKTSGPQGAVEMVLADGRKVKAGKVILESVSFQGAEAKNVEAAVLPDQGGESGTRDGFLGMSFLKNFNFKVDQKNGRLILENL